MADSAGSPELSHEEEDPVEQVDTGEAELEDIIDDADEDVAAGRGDVYQGGRKSNEIDDEEDIEEEVQEGLDLDMGEEEDGMGYPDDDDDDGGGYHEVDGRHGSIGYQREPYVKPAKEDEHPDTRSKADVHVNVAHHNFSHGSAEEAHQTDKQSDALKESTLQHDETLHAQEKDQADEKAEESFGDPLARPPHGSEVFVGGITKDAVEDDLRELCSSCGDIFEVD